MPACLTFDALAARTPERRLLFEGLSLSIGTERIGLVGRNGSGKSTLLRIAAGMQDPSAGTARRTGTAGMLAQDWPPDTVLAAALGVDDGLARLRRITAGQGSAADFDAADWTLEARVASALADTGLPATLDLDRAMGSLSGGERARVGIARLLIARPDLLLLDEPTNNLDAAGRAAIHDLLGSWSGGALVASHDRALLETMDRIVELTPVGIRIVSGGWSAFAALRDADRDRADAELERSAAALRHAEQTAQRQREAKDRRDRAGRAFAAKGSEPKIVLGAQARRAQNSGGRISRLGERAVNDAAARVQSARIAVEVLTPLAMTLPPSGTPSGARLLALEGVTVTRGERRLGPWTLDLMGPARMAVTGPNGAGKSTLLHIAAGMLAPSGGTVRRAEGRIAMVDQHNALLDHQASILANMRRLNPGLGEREAHAACARFAFRNRDAQRQVDTLSGGERLRASLACLLAGERPPWLLILDEPTNHLDLAAIEQLEAALRAFDGALLVTSHDRHFLGRIGIDRTFDVTERPNACTAPPTML